MAQLRNLLAIDIIYRNRNEMHTKTMELRDEDLLCKIKGVDLFAYLIVLYKETLIQFREEASAQITSHKPDTKNRKAVLISKIISTSHLPIQRHISVL